MARLSLISVACMLLVCAMPTQVDPTPTVSFADSTPLLMNLGTTETITLLNNTTNPVNVKVTLDPASTTTKLELQPQSDLTLDPATSVDVTIKAVAAASSWLAVADKSTGQVIRRSIKAGSLVNSGPAVETLARTISALPLTSYQQLGFLPLSKPTECTKENSEAIKATLASGGDYATLTAECDPVGAPAQLALSVADLDHFEVGTYKGTLTVGGTKVAVEVLRVAPMWVAIICLGLGVLIALLIRGYIARRPIKLTRRKVDDLSGPTQPPRDGPSPAPVPGDQPSVDKTKWRAAATAAFAGTQSRLKGRIADGKLWASWQNAPLRWIFAPPDSATALLTATGTDVESVKTIIDDWNNNAVSELERLTTHAFGDKYPGALGDRVIVLAQCQDGAFREPELHAQLPSGGSDSTNTDGGTSRSKTEVESLASILEEARAINAIGAANDRLTEIERAVEEADPPDASSGARYCMEWMRNLVEARLSVAGLSEEIAQAADARRLIKNGFEQRVIVLDQLANRLVLQPQPDSPEDEDEFIPQSAGPEPAAPGPTLWTPWPDFLSTVGPRLSRALATRSLAIGDSLVILLTLVIVIGLGLATLYQGKTWGSGWDMIAAIIAAAGGTLVLTPLISAIDRLGGTEAKEAAT